MEDREILRLFAARDERAIREAAAQYGARCTALAQRILGSREDAEECVNDCWHKLWNAIPPAEPASLEAYALTVVRRTAFDRLRAESAQKRGSGQLHRSLHELEDVLASQNDVQRRIEQTELAAAVSRFLHRQPPQTREVFVRHYWYLESAGDIARAMGLNRSSVKSMLRRTREKLRGYLQEEGLL